MWQGVKSSLLWRVGIAAAVALVAYAQPILDHYGAANVEMDIVEKPFTEATLLTRVSRALSREPSATAQELPACMPNVSRRASPRPTRAAGSRW